MNHGANLSKLLNLLVISIFVLLIYLQADKKFVLDEIDFPAVAKTVSETGLPYEYRGETAVKALGLWHPPLYLYSLGGFSKIFGTSETVVRMFGMCCVMLSALLCLLIYKDIFYKNDDLDNRFTAIFLPLFLLHPYTIGNATLPDIDSTVLPITFLIFIYGLIRVVGSSKNVGSMPWSLENTICLSLMFSLNLWAKLTTPLVLIPILCVVIYIKGVGFWRSFIIGLNVAWIGGLIFLISYSLYCQILSLPFGFAFEFLVHSFTKSSSQNSGLSAFARNILSHFEYSKYFVNWLGLPYVLALSVAAFYLVSKKSRFEGENILLVLAGTGCFVMAFYLGLTGAFGGFFKYPFPVFPLLTLVISHFLYVQLFCSDQNPHKPQHENTRYQRFFGNSVLVATFIFVLMFTSYIHFVWLKDRIIFRNDAVDFSILTAIFGVGAYVGLLAANYLNNTYVKVFSSILLAILLGSQVVISQSQAVAAYPTKYHYGQQGLDETVEYLKKYLVRNEAIWSMKDIGHYASGFYYENYGSIFKSQEGIQKEFDDLIKNRGVRYFVVTTGIGQDRVDAYTNLKLALDGCCYVEKSFGNFVIFKAK